MANLEIDLEEFSKENLIDLIQLAHEKDITFNEAINLILTKFLDANRECSEKI